MKKGIVIRAFSQSSDFLADTAFLTSLDDYKRVFDLAVRRGFQGIQPYAEIETGFNAKYVLEALGHLPEGTITMAIQDVGSPAILRADGAHRENLVVLMPMRV